jgi:hypothetical protein
VAATVTVYVPAVIIDGTVIDSVDVLDSSESIVSEDGSRAAFKPDEVDCVSETVSLNPLMDATLIEEDPEDPAGTDKAEGDAEME